MKILISSQDFGFGPTAQMFSFIKHLLINKFNGDIYIKKNKSIKIFYYNFIKDEKNYNKIKLTNNYVGKYDKYIGFYDPNIIFEGKRKKKETIFLCNLPFLRNTKLIKKYSKIFDFYKINLNEIKDHHELIILGYLIADKIFIRNTDNINKESLLYKKIKNKTKFIGPIIYPKIYKRNKKNFIIIQFGGQVNPLSNNNFYINYFKLIKKILKNVDINIKILVNPLLKKQAQYIFKKYKIITTLSQKRYQKLLSETKAIFSPFGINTFFESSYYNIPTFVLPEQHIGHIKSLIQYFGKLNDLKSNSYLLYNIKKYNLNSYNEKEFITYLNQNYKLMLNKNIKIDLNNFIKFGENLINKFGLEKNINNNINSLLNSIIN